MMNRWLKEVARGKRGARDLAYEEALQAAEAILEMKATPAQIGAFLIAQRVKEESVEELAAFVEACRKHAARAPLQQGIDCAAPYDGRRTSFMSGLAVAFVLAAAGLPATLHGADPLPPKWGVTLPDVLAAAGIPRASLAKSRCIAAARETGVLVVHAEDWCPPLKSLRPIREELGMRTVLNTAEKFADYGCSAYLTFGVFHSTMFDRIGRLTSRLGYRKGMVVQGSEGSDDLYIHRPTRICRIENGETCLQMIDPETYGLDTPLPERSWTAAEQAAATEQALQNAGHIAFIHQVLLNGAVRLHLAGRADSIEEGIYACKALLESGRPWALYRRWMELVKNQPSAV
ncbi:anthranilate phosphoribosyltransferase [Paenibacillus sp. FSL M7-1455]|uniref:anthranilate phosphoribosyltransferase n=1 Tax=Paenibacillus sp. FSL M7-1455 TaxID=2975316 RepID=UPI0030F5D92F